MIFSRNDYLIFAAALILLLLGFVLMAIDPVDNGFGPMTLRFAPPVLLLGFMLPILGIVGLHEIRRLRICLYTPDHILGLAVFLISLVTYLFTLEPTASLWDCSEFIASAYKLQVPHTPGTPLSLLIGRIFTMFALGDVKNVAWTINAMSGLFSALTIWLVYHIILFFGARISNSESKSKMVLIAAAVTGSLALTFSDTFWFSAVEAETYGAACFFLMLLVYLILRGIDLSEGSRMRMLILIFYVGGLSYCIHPMCVLALPLLPFAWYSKNRKLTIWSTLITVLGGMMLVLAINRIIGIASFETAFSFDFYFVNSLGLPFYSGAISLVMIVAALCYYVIKKYPKTQPLTWAFIFLVMGFTPYAMLFIRSAHNPPIDETNPENLSMIKAYMNRESYPTSPLLFGPYFDAQIDNISIRKNIYHKTKENYAFSGTMPEYHYEETRSTILPRMYSNDPDHVAAYRAWNGLKENEKPKFSDNLYFMFTYQIGHMYLRYLMFNFAGRESDHQNDSWLNPLDSLKGGGDTAYQNKARNQYWMIPLFIGLAGMSLQVKKDPKGFISMMILFLITGLILALYLNSPPIEPRERDYIYIGSFIAFCVWIGLGIVAIHELLRDRVWWKYTVMVISSAVPLLMLVENFDDHDRSGRTFQIDNARNLLTSCARNAIMFTGGDNDTFPLWYLQEVEGFRTDVRIMVLSYFNTDWYINQLRKKYYDSEPFKLTLDEKDYLQYGPNDVLYVQETIKDGIDFRKFIALLKQPNSPLLATSSTGDPYAILPSRTLRLSLNDSLVPKDGASLNKKVSYNIAPLQTPGVFEVKVKGNYLQKNGLAILDLIASNDWKRPIYFNYTSLNTAGLNVESHVVQEGNLYRLIPTATGARSAEEIPVDKDLMYKNLVERADYSNLKITSIYFNYEDYQARIINPVRQSFNNLAFVYLNEGNKEMAAKVMNFAVANLYQKHLFPSYTNLQAAEILASVDDLNTARALCKHLFDFSLDRVKGDRQLGRTGERLDMYLLKQSANVLKQLGSEELDSTQLLHLLKPAP